MSHQFDHEKLNVYHEALDFVGHATELLERVPKRVAVYDQLDRSSRKTRLGAFASCSNNTLCPRMRGSISCWSAARGAMFGMQTGNVIWILAVALPCARSDMRIRK